MRMFEQRKLIKAYNNKNITDYTVLVDMRSTSSQTARDRNDKMMRKVGATVNTILHIPGYREPYPAAEYRFGGFPTEKALKAVNLLDGFYVILYNTETTHDKPIKTVLHAAITAFTGIIIMGAILICVIR